MTAPFQVWSHRGTHLAAEHIEKLRALLVAEKLVQTRKLAQHDSAVAQLSHEAPDDVGVEREVALLHAARARDAIEEIDHALARLEDGRYGTCEVCALPIPFERLEAVPDARFCVACQRIAAPLAGAGDRLFVRSGGGVGGPAR